MSKVLPKQKVIIKELVLSTATWWQHTYIARAIIGANLIEPFRIGGSHRDHPVKFSTFIVVKSRPIKMK